MSLVEKTKELQQYQNMLMEAHITTGVEQWNKGFSAHKKETRKILLDELNKYRSWYQQQTVKKLGRTPNFKYETELLAKIELLKDLQKKVCQK